MRAILVIGALWILTHMFGDAAWLAPLMEDGTISAIREASLMVLLVLLVDWAFLPDVDLGKLIRFGIVRDAHGQWEHTLPPEVRAATIRGWFTFIAAVVIAVALVQYT